MPVKQGRPHKITEADARDIRRIYKLGYTITAIAILYEVTPQALGHYTRGLVTQKQQPNRLKEDDLLFADHMYKCGRPLESIAQKLGVSKQAIDYHMKRRGIVRRPKARKGKR